MSLLTYFKKRRTKETYGQMKQMCDQWDTFVSFLECKDVKRDLYESICVWDTFVTIVYSFVRLFLKYVKRDLKSLLECKHVRRDLYEPVGHICFNCS